MARLHMRIDEMLEEEILDSNDIDSIRREFYL